MGTDQGVICAYFLTTIVTVNKFARYFRQFVEKKATFVPVLKVNCYESEQCEKLQFHE